MLPLLRRAVPALALAALTLPALAAPTPKAGPTLKIDKYLLDDADGVLVVNVKQITASPAYTRGFKKQIADLLGRPEAQAYLKDIGFDLTRDIDRIILCMGPSCHRSEADLLKPGPSEDGPFILFQGKFDSAKMTAKMDALSKELPPKVGVSEEGGKKIYRLDPRHGPFAAQLDANTVVIAGKRAHVVEALAKAAGKKTTKFKYKETAAQLKKLKSDVAVQGFALGTFIYGGGSSVSDDGMGKRVVKVRNFTLGDAGLSEAVLTIAVKDNATGSVVFTVKDKAMLKKLTDDFTKWLAQVRMEGRRAAERDAKVMPLVRFVEGITIKSAGQTMTLEGKADIDMVQAFFYALFRVGL